MGEGQKVGVQRERTLPDARVTTFDEDGYIKCQDILLNFQNPKSYKKDALADRCKVEHPTFNII